MNNPDPFPRQGNVSTMRSTWKSYSDFIADLISFVVWKGNQPPGFYEEMAAGAERLLDGPDMVEAIHDLAYLNVNQATSTPQFRLGLVAMATAEGDKIISEAVSRSYRELLAPWKEVYAAVLEARELQLRPGITIDDVANLLAALVDGLELRMIGDPSDQLVDYDRKRTLLGTKLAALYSFFEPAKEATGLTLEQAVHNMIYGDTGPGEGADPAHE